MHNFEKYFKNLPIIPEVASKILAIGDDNQDFSFKNLDEIISLDPMLTSRILKVANSALYARQKEITTLQMAIGLLGFKNIKSLVLLLTASQFSRKLKKDKFYDDFWRHSIVTAFIAREIYYRNKDRTNQDKAFTLALLHDIGKVALFNSEPEKYKMVLIRSEQQTGGYVDIERDILETDHQEVGAEVMRHWNLPEIFAKTAGEHGKSQMNSPDAVMIKNISVADVIAGELGFGTPDENVKGGIETLLSGSDLSRDDLGYFLKDYQKVMEEDPLFRECEKLFLGEE